MSKDIIKEIKEKSLDRNDKFSQSIFDQRLMSHINKTRNEIIQQVAKENKKINDLIFTKR